MWALARLHARALVAGWLLVVGASLLVVCMASNGYWTGRDVSRPGWLLVSNALSPQQLLPLNDVPRIAALHGVRAVSELSSAAGWLGTLDHQVALIILDKGTAPTVIPSLAADPEALARWRADRGAALVSASLARALGAATTLPVKVADGGAIVDATLARAGTFSRGPLLDCDYCVVVGRDFADEALPSYRGIAGAILVRQQAGTSARAIARAVDATFADETIATRTGEFSAGLGAQLNQVLDVRSLAAGVLACMLATVLAVPALTCYLAAHVHRSHFALLLSLGARRGETLRCVAAAALAFGLSAAATAFAVAWSLDAAGATVDIAWLRLESPQFGASGAACIGAGCALAMLVAAWTALRDVRASSLVEAIA